MQYLQSKYLETEELKKKYLNNYPFPHLVLDNFIDELFLNIVEKSQKDANKKPEDQATAEKK